MNAIAQLNELRRTRDCFIGIDSDGCVFDNMAVKHRECFFPAVVRHFGAESIRHLAREVWDFVNLHSRTRGCNRFLALRHFRDRLRERAEVADAGYQPPPLKDLDAWLEREPALSNSTLARAARTTRSAELELVLAWSLEVNERVAACPGRMPPFRKAVQALEVASSFADTMVVSQASVAALKREWLEARLDRYVTLIGGQEHGTKAEQLRLATAGKGYPPGRILMVGDAPGDLQAATANRALFFPIIPSREAESWRRFVEEGLERFFRGTFAGTYQIRLLSEFHAALPVSPPWLPQPCGCPGEPIPTL